MDKYKIIIELQSDLCPGSGFDYAGVIDSDVCADSYGLPYIPARRLKGCFRETAETVCGLSGNEISALFGVRGDDGTKGFLIKNAFLENYTQMKDALERENRQKYPEKVLEQFTSVRAQTRLSEGVAKRDTLRYTRVINCRNSICEGKVKFVSELFCDPDQYRTLQTIVKCTRNIGMQRNRGLGSVKCWIESDNTDTDRPQEKLRSNSVEMDGRNAGSGCYEEGTQYRISFSVKNSAPLEISTDNSTSSLPYINGAGVRGCLAVNYWKMYPDGPVEEFERIFLKETIFNNLYPSAGNGVYYPAPFNLRRLKKTKDLVNLIAEGERVVDGDAGNRPQKIKTGFMKTIRETGGYQYDLCETEMGLQYHHRAGSPDEEVLYSLVTIIPGQIFSGTILTDGKNVKLIRKLVEEGKFSFGKSKAAQYGQCELAGDVNIEECKAEDVQDKADRFVLTFVSDALICGRTGVDYTTKREEVTEAVISALAGRCGCEKENINIPEDLQAFITVKDKERKAKEPVTPCWIETRMIYGYNTKWNLKRPSLPAVAAGSCMVLEVKNAQKEIPSEFYIGDRKSEGFGHILVSTYSDQTYLCHLISNDGADTDKNAQNEDMATAHEVGTENEKDSGRKLMNALNLDTLKKELLKDAFAGKPLNISKASLGRATLMLRESYRESISGQKTCENFLSILDKRYGSIRTDSSRREVKNFREESCKTFDNSVKEYMNRHHYEPDDSQKKDLLYRFMLTRLTAEKYRKEKSGKGGGKE